MKPFICRSLAGLAVLACSLAWGQEPTEQLFLADMPLVLTASRIAQSPLDAPAPVTVLDGETIRASGMTEIHDLLRLVPGFLVADWPRGGPMVANHGLGDAFSKRLLVLLDGYSVLDAAFGTVHWQDLPVRVEDIERIEVVRGPNQASFGANAYQGVVNIITRSPSEGAPLSVVVAGGQGNHHDFYTHLGRRGERVDWHLSASHRGATNFRDLNQLGYYYGEAIERHTLNAQVVYRPALDTEWRASLGLSQGMDAVGSTEYADTYPEHERKNSNALFNLAWNRRYAPDSELTLQYFHLDRRDRENYLYQHPPLASPIDYAVDTRRDELEFEQIHAFSEALKAVWGAGVRHDAVESERYFYQLGTVEGTQWQVFANLDWRFASDWLLHAGGMIEDHYNTDALFSPRLALNYHPSPSQSVRLSAGRGYRAPSMLESSAREAFVYRGIDLSPLLSPGDLVDLGVWTDTPARPESIDFLELGYVARYPDAGLQVDARVFEEWHRDFLDTLTCALAPYTGILAPICPFPPPDNYVQVQNPDKVFVPYNHGNVRVFGADLTLDWRHPVLGRFLFSQAVTEIKSGISDFDLDNDAVRSAPHYSASLLWSKAFPAGIDTSVGVYHVGAMKWMGDGDPQDAYTRVDLRLAKSLGGETGENELALTLQNLDGGHEEFRFDYGTVERRAFVTLRLSWW